jgi:hypothetical protein
VVTMAFTSNALPLEMYIVYILFLCRASQIVSIGIWSSSIMWSQGAGEKGKLLYNCQHITFLCCVISFWKAPFLEKRGLT